MDIKQIVAQSQTFTELWRIAEKINPENDVHFTFWGNEYVTIPGNEGVLNIGDLVARTQKVLWQNRDFAEAERIPGKSLANRIDLIYKKNDALYSGSRYLTRFFLIMRNLFSRIFSKDSIDYYNVREKWEGEDMYTGIFKGDFMEFNVYTRTQFQNAFGRLPGAERKFKSNPDRWFAP